jgi:hypothetical protein
MDSNQQILSKGFYQYAQIGNPVSVKDYIFIRNDQKKCLLLRFLNNLEYIVTAMDFNVIQMDSTGNVLGNTQILYKDLFFLSGSTYTEPAGIVVDEACSDFKVVFSKVTAGKYEYTLRGGCPIVQYVKGAEALEIEGEKGANISKTSAKTRRFGKPHLAAVAAVIAVLVMIGVTAWGTYQHSGFKIDWSLVGDFIDSINLFDRLK